LKINVDTLKINVDTFMNRTNCQRFSGGRIIVSVVSFYHNQGSQLLIWSIKAV
jgi:hypothetical protein